MRTLASIILFLIAIEIAIGVWIYTAGRHSSLRECPPIQQGERLLSSEQQADSTVCHYAAGAAAYGRTIKSREGK